MYPPTSVYPPGYYEPMPQAVPIFASFARRLGALLIDVFILSIIVIVVGVELDLPGFTGTNVNGTTSTTTYWVANTGWSAALSLIISGIYSIVSWVTLGGTPGQRILGIHVYSTSGRVRLDVTQAAVRWALLFGVMYGLGAAAVAVPSMFNLAGFLQLGWLILLIYTTYQDPRKQGLHDRLGGSFVVKD